ncbi:MAG TPA: hypothetical protein VGW40_14505 [Allosphingosinicella sp.]|nr:hypothetical protein [Allosphingosinicella sp.]
MVITRKLTVEIEDAEAAPAIFINEEAVVDFNEEGEAEIQLNPGENVLTYEVRGAGAKASFDVEGQPPIVVPVGATWPFEVKVPLQRTFALSNIYFMIGG